METLFEWISTLVFLALGSGCIALWSIIVRRHRNGVAHDFSPQPRLKLPIGMTDVVLAIMMWMVGQIIGLEVARAIVGDSFDVTALSVWDQTVLGYAVGLSVLTTTALTLVFLYGRYQRLESFGLGGGLSQIVNDIRLGAVVFIGFVPITFLIQAIVTQIWPYEHATLDLITPESSFATLASAWWAGVIVAPITEEFLFRGILQGWLSRLVIDNPSSNAPLLGGWPASVPATDASQDARHDSGTYLARSWAPVVISALLFALVHLGQGPAPIPIFVFGLGLGLVYRQTGRILPCIVAHFMLNCFSMASYSIINLYFPPEDVAPEQGIEPVTAAIGRAIELLAMS